MTELWQFRNDDYNIFFVFLNIIFSISTFIHYNTYLFYLVLLVKDLYMLSPRSNRTWWVPVTMLLHTAVSETGATRTDARWGTPSTDQPAAECRDCPTSSHRTWRYGTALYASQTPPGRGDRGHKLPE